MRALAFFVLTTTLLCASVGTACAQSGRAQVMIVGVAHLVARHDVHNSAFVDDPLGAKRQIQIAEVVAHLARFAPTKVLIEAGPDPIYNQRYLQYRASTFALPANEIYQFGFRLAAASANSAIYPVDADGPEFADEKTPDGKAMIASITSIFKTDRGRDPQFDAFVDKSDQLERSNTYLELLRYLNSDAAIRANAGAYSIIDGLGRDAHLAGAAYTAAWYGRNCYIFSNILNVTSPGDRVVVLMGQGHEYLLREFARLNPNLESVDPLRYLN
ncbi:MAG: DUF5694 domain-containing protein [Candidatus Eremiobacteraeota bacterium]|nr:DUF5694 domain-containing protein [Candidatus Eremiobacteraeota bacterium]